MALHSLKILSFPSLGDARCFLFSGLSKYVLKVSLDMRRFDNKVGYSQIICQSKHHLYQDFQSFVEPKQLLPAKDTKFCTESMLQDMIDSLKLDDSSAFYVIQIRTSNEFGSCLIDLNGAVLISLIDLSGNSILQRIPVVSSEDNFYEVEKTVYSIETVHFQRGSVDIITFQGTKLGKIQAIWIGLESGSWRLNDVRLTVLNGSKLSSPVIGEVSYDSLQYDFELNDTFLGEGGISVAELRPKDITEVSSKVVLAFKDSDSHTGSSLTNTKISTEESMKEYTDLKLSLLVYDSIFVASGTTILASSTSKEFAYAFAAGGICGFLYLLLLQRSVDGLSASALPSANDNIVDLVQRFSGPLSSLGLVLAAIAATTKYGLGNEGIVLTPQYLFLGFAGFLTCKLSVVLAAFRPMGKMKDK